jgi:hypothetical protein
VKCEIDSSIRFVERTDQQEVVVCLLTVCDLVIFFVCLCVECGGCVRVSILWMGIY